MAFKTVKITKKRRYYKKKKKNYSKIFFLFFSGFLGLIFLLGVVFYINVIKTLPDIKTLSQMQIKEASIIYDRNGRELYTLFGDEKRTYVNYPLISPNMINAIVAGEDKRFWENPGFDIIGLMRAGFYGIIGKNEGFAGTSTLTQQLIRNTIIENRSSLESKTDKVIRKAKEYILAYKLTNGASKEKIIEMYLNHIPFGSNAFGIEQASLTFFGKQAKDLSVLEGSILASLPKGPTFYSPYNYYTRLVGNLYSYPVGDPDSIEGIISKKDIEEKKEFTQLFTDIFQNTTGKRVGENGIKICGLDNKYFKKKISIDSSGCGVFAYSELSAKEFLNNFRFELDGRYLEYQTGRKDYILGRMLEDEYIGYDDYRDTILDGIGLEFQPYREKMIYPHFVMYVKEFLAKKYGEDILKEGGLRIYTTIDSKLQDAAQNIVSQQVASNITQYNANNAAVISIDNTNGDIITYIGGENYYNTDIDGNVDMLQSKRQPGSSFKPFVYALAIDKNPIGNNTPIYDLKTNFGGGYEPQNYEGGFKGKMTLTSALNGSRNIPAVKAYFLAGEQKAIIDYLKTTGVKSLKDDFSYGPPLALGSGEMTPMEVLGAYSVFSNLGKIIEINPILKILDSKGLIIEEKKSPITKEVLNEKTAYIMTNIMSDSASRPSDFWNTNLTLEKRKAGAKTGTSNKVFTKNGKKEILPGDLWTAGFTPEYTTVVWVGNTNGQAIKAGGDGLNGAAPIWKKLMEELHKGLPATEWKQPQDLKPVKISKISGLLAPESFDPSLTTSGLFTNIPKEYDNSLEKIEYDALCNGKVGPNTPPSAIKTGYNIIYHAIDRRYPSWEEGVQKWAKENGYKEFGNIGNIINNYKDEYCERSQELISNSHIEIRSNISNNEVFVNGYNYVEFAYKSNNPIVSIQVLLGENIIQEISIGNKVAGSYQGPITIPNGYIGDYSLTLRAIDSVYMAGSETKNISIIQKDTKPPVIYITNPERSQVAIYQDQFFNLRGYIEDRSKIRSINIYVNSTPITIGLEAREFAVEINNNTLGLEVGNHNIKIEAIDIFFNKSEHNIPLEILQK